MRRDKFYFPGAAELMPLETPPLRVSRPVAACQRCRQAKIRCDGKLPACTACEKSGRAKQCSSTNSQFAPGKERSYVATLEAKVERLQKRISEAKTRRKSSLSMIDVASPITPQLNSPANSIDRPRDRRLRFKQELTCIDELVSDFGFLTVNATARDLTYNFTHSISYAKLILAAATKEALPSGMKKELSSETATEDTALIKLYVDNLGQILPILDDASVWRSWHAVSGMDENATAMDYWTTRLILAISSAMQSQQRGDTKSFDALGHICAAMVVADQVLHPGSIYSIQALVLLVHYSMLDPLHFDSWTLIGAASRAMIDLGLHQDPSKSSNTPREKLELRRRVYHCVYALDRSTSIVQTRAFSFSDDSANVGLPFQRKPTSPSPTTNGTTAGNMWTRSYDISLAHLRMRQMQSAWYTTLFQTNREPMENAYNYIWKVYGEMTEWFNTLPANTSPQIKEFFEVDLLYSYVYILSPSSACPQPSEHAQRLVIEHCTSYANKISKRLSIPPTANLPSPFTFYDALRVYMVARDFVDTLMSNLDVLLQPSSHTPSYSHPSTDGDMDPLSSGPVYTAPAIPIPDPAESSSSPVARAIETIETFQSILSAFGMRFGYVSGVSWRDKFQQEAAPLLTQLQQRQHMAQMPQQQQHLQHHSQRHHSSPSDGPSYFWAPPTTSSATATSPGAPVTPQQQVIGASPASHHSASVSFYPSPPATQYSPAYVPPETHETINGAAASGGSSSAATGWFGANEFGIDNMTAWKTLPGGPMNARFS